MPKKQKRRIKKPPKAGGYGASKIELLIAVLSLLAAVLALIKELLL